MESFLQDLRFGARTLARNPGFACVAVLTLALGVGATAAIFSVVSAVLLRPLPWSEPDRAVMIWSRWTAIDKNVALQCVYILVFGSATWARFTTKDVLA